jgi:hypothetical protein
MVKRTRKYKHKGGGWFDGLFGQSSTTTYTPESQGMFSGVTNWFSGATQKAKETTTNVLGATEGALSTAQQKLTDVSSNIGSTIKDTVVGEPTSAYVPSTTTYGGKKRRHRKGGKGLGLTYYATSIPPGTSNVAQPTYWINSKGGKTRKHKRRKSRRQRK